VVVGGALDAGSGTSFPWSHLDSRRMALIFGCQNLEASTTPATRRTRCS
jgi:hypothetical protein